MVAGAEHPQVAVLIKDGKVAAGHGGKVRDLLPEAVGRDDIGIIPAEKVGGDGVPRLAAQKAPRDLADGDPCADPIRIVADKGDLLNPLARTLDTFIFAVVKGNGAVFLQKVGNGAAMPRQRRADRLLHLVDAVQRRKRSHRAEHIVLAESAEAVGIPENTGDALPIGGRGKFRPDIAVKQQPAVGGKGCRHGRRVSLKIVNAQVGEGAAGGKLQQKLLPLRREVGGAALLGQLHRPLRQKAHMAKIVAVGKGIGTLGAGVNGVQRIEAARRTAHFLPTDEKHPIQRRVIGKRFHCR